MSVELVMLANHLILCCLLLLPSVFPNIRVFSSELAFCIWWPKYWSFSISINPSNEYSELISFRIDWFDLLADQGTLKSLQNHSWKVSILQHSAFFVVQCSHPYTVSQSLSCVRLFAEFSMPGLPVGLQLPEFTQTHVHRVSDAIQSSHPLLSPSPPTFNLSQHQGLFEGVSSLHQVAKVLEFQLQHQSFQWVFRTDCL